MKTSLLQFVRMLRQVLVLTLVTLAYGRTPFLGRKTPRLDGRIVGGEDTTIEEHPYQCSFEFGGEHSCGCSIIRPNVVVIAAHCIHGFESWVPYMTVRAGSSVRDEGGQVAKVRRMHLHPKYDPFDSNNYDAGVLALDRSFQLNAAVQLIALQPVNVEVPTGTMGRVTGWGALVSEGESSKTLQKVDVPKIDQAKCKENYPLENISDNMHCFGYEEGGKDACQGDSGGPAVVDGKLVGIVSWGYGCGSEKQPGVYSKVANKEIQDFINSAARKYSESY